MERIIQMPVDPTYKIIAIRNNPSNKELFIILGITENQYNKIKTLTEGDSIKIVKDNCEFEVYAEDIFCYGNIDFHEGSDDCKKLDTFNWLEYLDLQGVGIPSKYNYDKHQCIGTNKGFYITETFRNSTLCRYLHGCLGKPEFTLIFREIV